MAPGEDYYDAVLGITLMVHAVIEAVNNFNEQGGDAIHLVAFGPEWCGIGRVPANELTEIVCAAYEQAPD